MIKIEDLRPGVRLVGSYRDVTYDAVVGEGGRITIEHEGFAGRVFKSLSGAGKAITGRVSCEGTRFWSMAGEVRVSRKEAQRERNRVRRYRVIQVMKNQDAVPEGKVRLWCDGCMAIFMGEAGAEITSCPQGHSADDPELTSTTGLPEEGHVSVAHREEKAKATKARKK